MFFVICLPWLPKNRFLCLTTNSLNKLMVWLWDLHQVQFQLIFLCAVLKKKWLKDCHYSLKSVFYRRYVDDVFVLFSSFDQAEKFKKHSSSKHPSIKFSLEKENDRRLSFLGINIFSEKEKFVTNVYRRQIYSGAYTNFNSFIPETYKTGLIASLLF